MMMNPRKLNSSMKPFFSLNLVIYGITIIFIVSAFIAIITNNFHSISQNLHLELHPQAKKCSIPESKQRAIQNLEPLIPQEPFEIWEGLGKEEKNIKYLTNMVDLNHKDRFIYIDLGARDYDSSIGSWFVKQYPKQSKHFEIYAVEADKAFHHQYESRKGVTLVPYAAWIRNESVVFGSKPIMVKDKVWRMRPFGRIEGQRAEEDKLSSVTKVPAFDFVDWLQRTIRPQDFVVVKMDVEGTEITLIRELVNRGAICLIDELFMECHWDRFAKCCSGERINRFNYSYNQCYDLFQELRGMGCVAHQWW